MGRTFAASLLHSFAKMSSGTNTKAVIPESAYMKFIPIKRLGSGREGFMVLAVSRTGFQGPTTYIALKILMGEKRCTITSKLLEDVKNMERGMIT